MKAIKIIPVLVLILLAFSYQACDKIEEPYLVATDTLGGNGEPNPTDVRKVLLEEFTGHTCVNCPEAAEEIETLLAIYGEQLVPVSIHSGVFAAPSFAPFTYDFRTPEGNILHDFFGVQSYPSGVVNRIASQGSTVLGKDKWATAVQDALEKPQQASIMISNAYDDGSRTLSTDLEIEYIEELTGTYYVTVYIIENGIIKPQLGDEGVIEEYEHNHVFRAAMNGAWGDLVGENGIAVTDETFEAHYTFTLDDEWVAGNCEVVAFVYNGDSQTREVVQAEISPVTE